MGRDLRDWSAERQASLVDGDRREIRIALIALLIRLVERFAAGRLGF
jgi:hypothetical protein